MKGPDMYPIFALLLAACAAVLLDPAGPALGARARRLVGEDPEAPTASALGPGSASQRLMVGQALGPAGETAPGSGRVRGRG